LSQDAKPAKKTAKKTLFPDAKPALGLDLDGCVDECPVFFKLLTQFWPGKVFIVSYRSDKEKAEAELKSYDIRYDELILVDSLAGKAQVVKKKNILIFFDDQPECLKNMDVFTNVMLVRNGGNFDFHDQKWMLSDKTGKLV